MPRLENWGGGIKSLSWHDNSSDLIQFILVYIYIFMDQFLNIFNCVFGEYLKFSVYRSLNATLVIV